LGPFTKLTSLQIPYLDLEQEVAKFRFLQNLWEEKGSFESLQQFLSTYEVIAYLLEGENHNGERALSNVLQLIELVHQIEFRRAYNRDELIVWIKKSMDQRSNDDSYLQRIESDKQCVSISTIHSSKGLSYPIVFAPFLNLNPGITAGKLISYKNPHTKKRHFSLRHTEEEKEWTLKEQEQENRRLIYVALTRAVYKSFIFDNQRFASSFLHQNLSELQAKGKFAYSSPSEFDAPKTSRIGVELRRQNVPFKGSVQSKWGVVSFSKLSPSGHYREIVDSDVDHEPYEQFVFQDLMKGPHLGNFLHDLFERTQFSKPDSWLYTLKRVGSMHPQIYKEEFESNYIAMIEHMVGSNIPAPGSFRLADIKNSSTLREMEFYFKIND
jgi:exodeoxyribonuclease V beta subunit